MPPKYGDAANECDALLITPEVQFTPCMATMHCAPGDIRRMRALLLLACAAAPLLAQSTSISLGKPVGTITEAFSDAMGLAELDDGRVIVSDRVEKAYFIADFRNGERKVAGRNGTGPNEYQVPFGPIRWKGDTLLGHDPQNRRALRIGQDGRIISTIPFASPRAGGVNGWAAAKGVDAKGRIYWDTPIIEMQPVIKRSMKANLVRWLPGADSVEVVMQFADHGEFEHDYRYRPIPQTDAWVLGRDGRIGILSAAEYRLRWYLDGKVVETAPPVPFTPLPVTAAEREAFREKKAMEPAAGGLMQPGQTMQTSRLGMERARAAWPDSIFPARIPPFEAGGAMLAANGDIWVKRTGPAAETSQRIDVLDSHGRLRAVLRMPAKTKLFALGQSSVYVLAVDDDGLQSLQKYEYPAELR
jgi:hypothetical protein